MEAEPRMGRLPLIWGFTLHLLPKNEGPGSCACQSSLRGHLLPVGSSQLYHQASLMVTVVPVVGQLSLACPACLVILCLGQEAIAQR